MEAQAAPRGAHARRGDDGAMLLNTAAAEQARERLGGETAQLKRAAVLEHASTMQRNVGNAVAAALQSVQAAQAGGRGQEGHSRYDAPPRRSSGGSGSGSRQSLSNAHVESRAALKARVRSAAGAEAAPAAKAAARGAAGKGAGVPPQPGRDKAPKRSKSSKSSKSRGSHATVEADSADSRAAKAAEREAQREEMRRKIAQDRRRMATEKPAPLAVVFEPQMAQAPPSTVNTDITEEREQHGGGGFAAAAPSVPLTPGGRHVARYAAPQSPAQRAAGEMRHFASNPEGFGAGQAVRPSSKGSPTLQVHRAPKEGSVSAREEHSPDTEQRRLARAQQREALAARREADNERIQRLKHAQEPSSARGLSRPGAPGGVAVDGDADSNVRLSFSPHQQEQDSGRDGKHQDSDDDSVDGPTSSPAAAELQAAEEQASAAKQELEYVSMLVDLHATLHATGGKGGGLAGAIQAAAAQGKDAEAAAADDDEWLDTDSDAEDAELEADAEAIAQAMGALPGGAADADTPEKGDRVGAGAQRPPRPARGNAAAHLVTAHGAPVRTGVRNLVEVQSSDTPMHKAESMRQWLEDELGFEKFLLAYDALANAPPGAAPDRVMTIIGHHEKAFDVLMELLAVEARLYSAAPSSSAVQGNGGVSWAAGPPPSP